ncbi:uncharacterized protein PRCAT00003096001 [Priceomyces carsonii]|uniref:uncharacterized protein n=1 Tax=Priceomyces carsonii TaxID=28549 RepID=UPI002EDA0BDD|nr:unnamed protein product [Priceomyces carsonii]
MKTHIIPLLVLPLISQCHYIPIDVPSMHFGGILQLIFSLTSLSALESVAIKDNPDAPENSDLESWIEGERESALKGILNNFFGPSDWMHEPEVAKGAVIASPSREQPNYFFQWVRDAALTVKTLVLYLDDSNFLDEKLGPLIETFIESQYHIQRLTNKSGKFDDECRSGLGEPKFMPDATPFQDSWGRPQRDGPSLRAITIMMYLNLLKKHDKSLSNEFLKSPEFIYYEIIKPDLFYATKNWKKEGFDLWEEIEGFHLFTSLTQLRSLRDGIEFAEQIGDQDLEFIGEMKLAFDDLKNFIENDSGYSPEFKSHLVESPKYVASGDRSGLDAAILLASIHSHNLDYGDYSEIPYDADSYKLLNTLNAMVADMKVRYPVNRLSYHEGGGTGLGRYPEDIYDGYERSEGNPWFIATASAAEVVYKFIFKLISNKQDVVINEHNIDFLKQFVDLGLSKSVTIEYGSPKFDDMVKLLFTFSDSFLEVVKEHTDKDGHMSEQFNRYHGYMQGAKDLSWSYSAAWNAFRWRTKTVELFNN